MYDDTIASFSPLSYLKLQGNVLAAIGSDGTNHGATFGDDGPWTGATAATFNGTNQYVSVPVSMAAGHAFSVMAWVYLTANGSYPMVVTFGSYSTPDLRFSGATRQPEFGPILSATPIPLNTWTLLVGITDGVNGKLYVNAVEVGSSSGFGAFAGAFTGIDIGRRFDGIYFPGRIARLVITDDVLTPTEISNAYADQAEGGGGGPTMSADYSSVLAGQTGVSLTLTRSETGWTGAETLTVSGVAGVSKINQTNVDGSTYQLAIETVGATNGTLTISDGTIETTVTVTGTASSAANGDWTLQATWAELGIPNTNNTASIGHNVAATTNITVDAVVMDGGTLTVTNANLTVNGNITGSETGITINPDGKITIAGDFIHAPILAGTAGHEAIIESAGLITDNDQGFDPTQEGWNHFTIQGTTEIYASVAAPNMHDGHFDGTGKYHGINLYLTADLNVERVTFVNSLTSDYDFHIQNVEAGTATGLRIFDQVVCPIGLLLRVPTVTNSVLLGLVGYAGGLGFSGNILGLFLGGNGRYNGVTPNGQTTDTNFWIAWSGDGTLLLNCHWIVPTGAGDNVLNNQIFDGGDANADGDVWLHLDFVTTWTANGNIGLKGHQGNSPGTLITAFGIAGTQIDSEHNTWFTGIQSLVCGEGYDGHTGLFRSVQSNIVHSDAGLVTAGQFSVGPWKFCHTNHVQGGSPPSGAVQNLITTADYNAGFNLNTGAYAGKAYNAPFSYTPGVHDVDGQDPQFVREACNLAEWGKSLGVTGADDIEIAVNTMAQVVKLNDSDFDSRFTPANLISWVQASRAPQNAAYEDAGHDGETFGAVAFAVPVEPSVASDATIGSGLNLVTDD